MEGNSTSYTTGSFLEEGLGIVTSQMQSSKKSDLNYSILMITELK